MILRKMNKYVLAMALALGFVTVQAQVAEHSMSLQEAIQFGLEHNQNLLNARLDVTAAEGMVKENIASGLPQINANIDLADNFELPTTYLPAEIIGGTPGTYVPVQFGTQFSGNANVNISQMVFDGVFFVGLEAAKTYKELSTKQEVLTEVDVVEKVTKAYYNVLVNELTLELIEKNFGRLDTLLSETKTMRENGFAELLDVNRVQVQYNNMKVELSNNRKMLEVAYSLLKFQMGMPVGEKLALTDKLSLDMFKEVQEDDSFDYDNRIEYSIMQTQERLAMLDIKRTNMMYLPKLDFYTNLGAVAGTGEGASLFNIGNEWFWFGIMGIKLNIPVFDGLMKHRMNQQKKAALDQVYNSYDLLKNSIDMEIQQAKINYNNSIEYMNVQLENVHISEEVYNVTKTKYQEGLGSNIEVINADAEYKQAQTNFFNALYAALISKVDYEKALGKLN